MDANQFAVAMPGTYEVTYVRHELRDLVHSRAKELVMWFCVLNQGPAFGLHVPKYYNVGNTDPAEQHASSFKVGFKNNLYRDYVRLVDENPRGGNRVWINSFKDKVFKAEIRLVDRVDRDQSEAAMNLVGFAFIARFLEAGA
jgi:hypothetical protein